MLKIVNKLEDSYEPIKRMRDKIQQNWKKKIKDQQQLSMLQVIFQSHCSNIDNIILKNKQEVEETRNKAKDIELKYLKLQINLRDSVINQTKKQLSLTKMELIYEEDPLESVEVVAKRMKMSFPTLPVNTLTPSKAKDKNRSQSINVRIENHAVNESGSLPNINTGNKPLNTSRKINTLKPLKPVIRNNYLTNTNRNYRYGGPSSK